MVILIEKKSQIDLYIVSYMYLYSRWIQNLCVKIKSKLHGDSLPFPSRGVQQNTMIPDHTFMCI